jgi:hypothetical protein
LQLPSNDLDFPRRIKLKNKSNSRNNKYNRGMDPYATICTEWWGGPTGILLAFGLMVAWDFKITLTLDWWRDSLALTTTISPRDNMTILY